MWYAIAHTAAWLNLFNLLPIWQLDGGRGFRALTRKQRGMAAGVAIAMWALTHQMILLLIALGAGYRLFTRAGRRDRCRICRSRRECGAAWIARGAG